MTARLASSVAVGVLIGLYGVFRLLELGGVGDNLVDRGVAGGRRRPPRRSSGPDRRVVGALAVPPCARAPGGRPAAGGDWWSSAP